MHKYMLIIPSIIFGLLGGFTFGYLYANGNWQDDYPATNISRDGFIVTFTSRGRVVGNVSTRTGWVCSGGHCEAMGISYEDMSEFEKEELGRQLKASLQN